MTAATRRELLLGASALALTAAAPATARARDRTARRPVQLARGGRFPQGVMSGQPGQRAVTLWTRHAEAERPGPLLLQVARDPGFRGLVHQQRVPGSATASRVRLRSRALRPGERYWYRFAGADGTASPTGRVQTLRPPDSREPVRVGVFSCQMYFLGWFTPHAALAEEDLDLVVGLGDYVYETYLDGLSRREPRPDGAQEGAETLAEYRAKYAAYRQDDHLRAMHAAHSFLPIWDDHEVANDYAGDSGPAGRDGRPFAARRADALQAWFEAMPVERPPRVAGRIHRRLRLGAHADLFVLDGRTHRVDGRTLLGDHQTRWLTHGLATSRATWKLLGNPVPLMNLDSPGSPDISGVNGGSWAAFPAERAALGEQLLARKVQDVVALTGDAHAYYAGTVTTSGREDGRPFATEVVCGTLAATNAATTALLEGAAPVSSAALAAMDRSSNPHLAYSEPARHGYAVIEAGPDELRVRLRAARTIYAPTSPTTTIATLGIARSDTSVRVG